MTESQLQSVHLEGERRQRFRRARSQVIRARGTETFIEERAGCESSRIDETAVYPEIIKNVDADFMLILRSEWVYPLHTGLNTIGRFRSNDIVLKPRHFSRRHCGILIHTTGVCELFDLASRNGVYHNNRRVRDSITLASGDIIRLCDHHFVFFSRSVTL